MIRLLPQHALPLLFIYIDHLNIFQPFNRFFYINTFNAIRIMVDIFVSANSPTVLVYNKEISTFLQWGCILLNEKCFNNTVLQGVEGNYEYPSLVIIDYI